MRKTAAGLFLFILIFASPAWAQPALDEQISRVEAFIFNGDFERAALLAERLYSENKNNLRLYGLLRSAYLGLKEYTKLEAVIAEQLTRAPKNKNLHLDQLELFLRQGAPDKADGVVKTYLNL